MLGAMGETNVPRFTLIKAKINLGIFQEGTVSIRVREADRWCIEKSLSKEGLMKKQG